VVGLTSLSIEEAAMRGALQLPLLRPWPGSTPYLTQQDFTVHGTIVQLRRILKVLSPRDNASESNSACAASDPRGVPQPAGPPAGRSCVVALFSFFWMLL